MSLGARYWNARFSSWGTPVPERPGYSLLMPVPGDLPVFLELALAVCRLQQQEHRLETIVIPDRLTAAMRRIVDDHQASWPGELRLLPLAQPERALLHRRRNPAHNHGVQIINGIAAAAGSHIVLHDADLFLLRSDALEQHYLSAVHRDLYVAGVGPASDPWFTERGYSLVATWEMCARRSWLRSYPPHMHMRHEGELYGETHTFDTTLHPQALTDPARIGLLTQDDAVVHFDYVVSCYRHFQRSSGPCLDDLFRLLLIRVFVDIFAREPFDYGVPSLDALADGLTNTRARVIYPPADAETREDYARFRDTLDLVLDGPWTPLGERESTRAALARFDAHYGRS